MNNCWRWVGVIFNGVEALNVVGSIGVAVVGGCAAIAAIVYGAVKDCTPQSLAIGFATWFLFESAVFIFMGVLTFRKARETLSLRRENSKLASDLRAARGEKRALRKEADQLGAELSDCERALDEAERGEHDVSSLQAENDDLYLAVEALEGNNRVLSETRKSLRSTTQAQEVALQTLRPYGERLRRLQKQNVKALRAVADAGVAGEDFREAVSKLHRTSNTTGASSKEVDLLMGALRILVKELGEGPHNDTGDSVLE